MDAYPSPAESLKKYVDVVLVNTQTLEHADRIRRSLHADRSDRSYQPVKLVGSRSTARPKTPILGGTPSELGDLGFSWSRHATQDALERCGDEQRIAKGWKISGLSKQ